VELGELQVARVHRLRAGELENVLQNKINIFF
jgi:transposase-like protein